jgi:hypothetical protein
MPLALESLAVWPVISGLTFMLRSLGIAFNEVVVTSLDEPLSTSSLWRFTKKLAIGTTAFQLFMILTPLANFWFGRVLALPEDLATLAKFGFLLALPMPALAALQSWYQGSILYSRKTKGIPEAVVIFLVTVTLILGIGMILNTIIGLYVGLLAFSVAMFTQTIWLWYRSRPAVAAAKARDKALQDQAHS